MPMINKYTDLNKKFNTIVHLQNLQLFDNEFPYDNSKHSTTFLFGQFCDITKMIIMHGKILTKFGYKMYENKMN